MPTLTAINAALNKIPKRAESRAEAELRSTFEDSGVGLALDTVDHQIIYGRRGTGKTHALRYLSSIRGDVENITIYVDLRTIGSAEGIFDGENVGPVERTARLLVDLLNLIHDEILQAALDDEGLVTNTSFVSALDSLLESISAIRVTGTVARTTRNSSRSQRSSSVGASISSNGQIAAHFEAGDEEAKETDREETRQGEEKISLNFSDVARALRSLAETLSAKRIWVLLDEWTSVPPEVQPYLGAFLVRCLLPLQPFTVKIATIEQQAVFRRQLGNGSFVGIEVGADMSANLNLDDFMVFEQEEERARAFFLSLFFKHLTASSKEEQGELRLTRESELISLGFTDTRAFDELVRAAEGVPRDAINIAANAAWRAGDRKISIPDVRRAARQWFQNDKERAIADVPEAQALLNWVIDRVIRGKKARGFLVNQKDKGARALVALFDARVLHLVRRGYSAQDAPGERYDVYVIDYGAYVDLINTQNAPAGMLPMEEADGSDGHVEVPTQDLRALRRAVLDFDEFGKESLDEPNEEH
ncbi:hypothetical protein [Microbacterium sp. SY138]|uniref:hypothetical protein n=1 Tax=Microbacterium sp. SY138 TaxID=3149040 RepID=UPI00321B6407